MTIAGLVEREVTLSLDDLGHMPQFEVELDIHCVTRWSKPAMRFGGVLLADVLRLAGPMANARFVSFAARSDRRHSTSLPLDDALKLGAQVALRHARNALPTEHGGPVRLITPARYFYKSLKWLTRITLLADDQLGYWESTAGYHNHADPWLEERFVEARHSRADMRAVLAAGDLSDREILGLVATGGDLRGLAARGAKLRDADFSRANLRDACFEGANLSNARFVGADLRGATFKAADLEGVDFAGADLRGADLSGASLVASTYGVLSESPAVVDGTTIIEPSQLDGLTPTEAAFLDKSLSFPR